MADTEDIITDALTEALGLERPQRPVVEYEDITIREVTIGFPSGPQDMTLYPEDTLEEDQNGNIHIVFHTMGGGEFTARSDKIEWDSYRETPHKRVKGELRPDPQKMWLEFQKARRESYLQKVREAEARSRVED